MMEDFCRALEQSYDTNMVCKLSDVLDALLATDVNFEVISSQTSKPLLMLYDHNVVQKLRAYIFIQTCLTGFLDWTGTPDGFHRGENAD